MNESIISLVTCLMLMVLWAVWHFGWKQFALDQLRQSLFSIRGELFDLVLKGDFEIGFSSPSYIEVRKSLNNRIRFAHRISFTHVWLGILVSRIFGFHDDIRDYTPKAQMEIESIENADLKKQLEQIQFRSNLYMLRYLMFTSPLLLLCTIITFVLALINVLFQLSFKLKDAFQMAIERAAKREIAYSVRAVNFQADTLAAEPSLAA